MNHRIFVIRSVFQAYSKRCMHKHGQEVASIVHSNVEMVDAVRQQLFVRDAMVAVITVTNKIAVCAVSNKWEKMSAIKTNYYLCQFSGCPAPVKWARVFDMHLWRERKIIIGFKAERVEIIPNITHITWRNRNRKKPQQNETKFQRFSHW